MKLSKSEIEELNKIGRDDLEPATDEEILQAMKEVLDESEDELNEWLNTPLPPEVEERIDRYCEELEKAKTMEERIAVIKKYEPENFTEDGNYILDEGGSDIFE